MWAKLSLGPTLPKPGPILFTVFINDIPVDIASSIKIFADDTKIYNTTHHCDIIQSDLDKLAYWSEKWLLPFNVDKCKVLHYGKKTQNKIMRCMEIL